MSVEVVVPGLAKSFRSPLGAILRQHLLCSSGLILVLVFDGYPTLELWDISSNSWSCTALHRELSLVPSSEGPLTQIDIDTPGYITRTRSFPYWDRVFLDDVVFPAGCHPITATYQACQEC